MNSEDIKEAFGDTSALKAKPVKQSENVKKLIEDLKKMGIGTEKTGYATIDTWKSPMTTVDDIAVKERRITGNTLLGHQHVGISPTHHSMLVNGSVLSSAVNTHSVYSSATIASGYREKMNLTADGRIEIINSNGDKIVEFNTELGTIKFLEDFNMDTAARIFWESIMKSGSAAVARTEYDRISHENARLYDELRRTKELLTKSLKELAKEYTKGDETDSI